MARCGYAGVDSSLQAALICCTVFAGSLFQSLTAIGAEQATPSEADKLVAKAVDAEIQGDSARSFSLLRDAIRIDPSHAIAHSQLGEVKVDGKWISTEEAQRRAAADPLQTEYIERRKDAQKGTQAQLALARWCRKNNLTQEARFHWSNVLSMEPKNEEALRALDLRWQKGQLVSRTQSGQGKDQLQEAKRAAARWESKLVKWRRAVSGPDAAARESALAEILAIAVSDAIPSLEEVTLGRDANDARHADECGAIALAFVEALGKMQGQLATESIARHAVFSPAEKVRASAITLLKARDQHDYVPMLLGGLGMPFESTYSLSVGPDGSVHYYRSLYREGAEADWSWESRRQAVQRDLGGRNYEYDVHTGKTDASRPTESAVVVAAKKATVAAKYQTGYQNDALATERKIVNTNQAIENLNARIVPVLAGATGKDLGDNPKAWWDWWRDQNEYYTDDHPVSTGYDFGADYYTYGRPTSTTVDSSPPPPPMPRRHSCFAQGTLVWTKTGTRAIETIEAGDLVLSQDVDNGELKYVTVLLRTVRPPSKLLKVSMEGEEFSSTPGHPFWVSGLGWRMAKELKEGQVVHGVSRSIRVKSIGPGAEAEAYNLVLGENNNYFVGETGVLAHDITTQRPTQSIVPGFAKPRGSEVSALPAR